MDSAKVKKLGVSIAVMTPGIVGALGTVILECLALMNRHGNR